MFKFYRYNFRKFKDTYSRFIMQSSVNFIRSDGQISELIINNSAHDGIDLDFQI